MTNQLIRRFKMEGTFTDNMYLSVKDTALRELKADMRDQGWVPVLDLDPTWSTKMVENHFQYELIMQGVYVGERAWDFQGVTNGRLVPSSPKSN